MSEIDTFIETCTSGVHPTTVAAIIELVTGADPFLMTVLPANGKYYRAAAEDVQTVVRKGIKEIEQGGEVSVGLMQVSSHYWLDYDVTIMDMMDPCTNIQVGTSLFATAFKRHFKLDGDSDRAMRFALKEYVESNLFEGGSEAVNTVFGATRDSNTNLVVDRSSWSAEIRVNEFDELTIDGGDSEKGYE